MPDEPLDPVRAQASSSIGWIAVDRWATRLVSLLVLLVLGRLLSPADFGLVAMATIVTSLVGLFVDQGFSKALIQRSALQPAHLDTVFWVVLATSIALAAGLALSARALAQAFDSTALAALIPWLALPLVCNALSTVPAALLEREFRFKALAMRRTAAALAGGAAAVAVAIAGGGLWSLVVQSLVAAVLGVLVLWSVTSWRPGLRLERQALRDVRPVGLAVLGVELTNFATSQFDRALVGAFLGAQALGFYFMAMRIVSIMVELFSSIFSAGSLTLFSRLQHDRPQLIDWLCRLAGVSAQVTIPCFAVAASVAPLAIPLVLGTQWTPSVLVFQILTLLGAINAVAVFDKSALLATGRARAAWLLALGQCALGVALVAVACPFGVLAIAWAVVARQYLYWPVRLSILRHAIGVRPLAYFAQWLRPFVASLPMVVLAPFAMRWAPLAALHPALAAAVVGFAGLTSYLILLRLIHPPALVNLRAMVAGLRRR